MAVDFSKAAEWGTRAATTFSNNGEFHHSIKRARQISSLLFPRLDGLAISAQNSIGEVLNNNLGPSALTLAHKFSEIALNNNIVTGLTIVGALATMAALAYGAWWLGGKISNRLGGSGGSFNYSSPSLESYSSRPKSNLPYSTTRSSRAYTEHDPIFTFHMRP